MGVSCVRKALCTVKIQRAFEDTAYCKLLNIMSSLTSAPSKHPRWPRGQEAFCCPACPQTLQREKENRPVIKSTEEQAVRLIFFCMYCSGNRTPQTNARNTNYEAHMRMKLISLQVLYCFLSLPVWTDAQKLSRTPPGPQYQIRTAEASNRRTEQLLGSQPLQGADIHS